MKDTIMDWILYIFLAFIFILLGLSFGVRVGEFCERNEVQKIHEEIGIEIVKTTIGAKTTYSYNVIDPKKETK